MRIVRASLLVCIACIAPACSDNKIVQVPGTAYSGDQYYFTRDMAPVAVHFIRGRGGAIQVTTASDEPIVATGEVPRGYIFFASPYDRSTAQSLPNEIWTSNLGLILTVPTGEPYSIAVERVSAERSISQDSAGEELRLSTAVIHVRPALPEFISDPLLLRVRRADHREKPYGETEDGMQIYGFSRTGPLTHLDTGNPAVRRVGCSTDPERSHPEYYCDYEIILADDLFAQASFVDFRLHGGRRFARQRVAEIRQTLCQFFPCDNAYTAALD
jgi:hypothetical protein